MQTQSQRLETFGETIVVEISDVSLALLHSSTRCATELHPIFLACALS